MKEKFIIITIIIFTFILVLLNDFNFLKPLTYYVTSVHEVSHALMSILTGGSVHEIDLHNQGGYAVTSGGIFPLISIAGYVGTTIVGALFILSSIKEKWTDIYLFIFLIITTFMNIIFIKSFVNFYFISTIVINIFLLISIKFSFTRYINLFFGMFFLLDSISDAKAYLFSKILNINSKFIYQTDAGILARWIGFEFLALPIALTIFLINIFIIWKTINLYVKIHNNELEKVKN